MKAVILGNGDWKNLPDLPLKIKESDFVIACDGAYDKAKRYGIKPHLIIGDFDSIQKKPAGVQSMHYPREKDETDGELAFRYAFNKKPERILWIAPFGDRWDYTLANVSLLMQAAARKIPVTMLQGDWDIHLVLSSLYMEGKTGDRISLHPLSDRVTGIRTNGLKYPLKGERLYADSTRGLSNEMTARRCSIKIKNGRLLVFHHAREGVSSR